MALTITKQPNNFELSGNPVLVNVESDTVVSSNHKITVRIIYDSETIGEEEMPVIEGAASFDIADYLKRNITSGFEITDLFETGIVEVTAPVTEFELEIFETYDNDGIEHNTENISAFKVLQGGFSKLFLNRYNLESKNFYDDFVSTDKFFLTWSPNKKILPNQHEILFFIYTGTTQDLKVRYTFSYQNGSSSSVDSDPVEVSEDKLYMICPSYLANEFADTESEGNLILSYTVSLIDENNAICGQIRNYQVNRNTYNYTRQFLFKNSFGVYDVLLLKGLSEAIAEIQRSVGYFDTTDRVSSSEYNESVKAASGFLVTHFSNLMYAQRYITEFVNSREIYEIVGQEIIPVIPETSKLRINKDADFLYSFSFEYRYAHTDSFYSPLNTAQYLDADYNNDYGNDFYI